MIPKITMHNTIRLDGSVVGFDVDMELELLKCDAVGSNYVHLVYGIEK